MTDAIRSFHSGNPAGGMSKLLGLVMAAALALVCIGPADAEVTIDWVTVGDPGNASDPAPFGFFSNSYGDVANAYRIGKYEVTIGQYTQFLNAVAATDLYGLYNTSSGTNLNVAGIMRSGSSGSYTYSVMDNGGNSANRPITYVSWFDAARFANWMQNGQGSGSTETGAYTLNGATSGEAPAVNPDAQFYIPTANEWYKAAYYSPVLNSGSGGYYRYATQSDSAPGNIIGGAANQANYRADLETGNFAVTQSPDFVNAQNYLTDVGAFTNSASYYGTFDQSGNVYEWNDVTGLTPGLVRGVLGGSWGAFGLGTGIELGFGPSDESEDLGFRLARPVPEPSTWAMAAGGIACAAWGAWRRRRAKSALADFQRVRSRALDEPRSG